MLDKKYSLLISSILYFIFVFLLFWFINDLGNFVYIFFFIPIVIPIIFFIFIYITLIIKSIENIIKKKNYIDVLSILILLFCTYLQFNFPFEEEKLKLEWNIYNDKRYKVIELVKKDKLGCIGNTISAPLPDNLKKVSQTGEILIYKSNKKKQVIGFFINRGMLSGSTLLIYSSNGKKDILDNVSDIITIKKIKNNWYFVKTDY